MMFFLDDCAGHASDFLIFSALEAVRKAQEVKLDDLCHRMRAPSYYPNFWQREHYKLLAGRVLTSRPRVIVEMGTSMGLSALWMKEYLPPDSKIFTFDIQDWKSHPDNCLKEEDFADGRPTQFLDDWSDPAVFRKYRSVLKKANLIFIDAEKDGITEEKFLEKFYEVDFEEKVVILLDDIRLWNMLKIWRDISRPKLDLSSFGHLAGTGIVEWTDSFRPRFLGARAVRTARSRWGFQVFRFEDTTLPSRPSL